MSDRGFPGLVATGLVQIANGRRLVDEVSLTVAPGEMVALFGPSGSGKTSLLTLLAGISAPDYGSIHFAGEPVVAGMRPDVSVVLQGYGLVPVLSAAENVEVVLQVRGLPAGEVTSRAREALKRVRLEDIGDRPVERISGGQQQRVAVARALVAQPALLLADEPTSELDEVTRDFIVDELRREADRGTVVVVATHDPDVIAARDRSMQAVEGRLLPDVQHTWRPHSP